MSQQTIDTSTTTDTLQSGLNKVNSNFTEVYASLIQVGFIIDYIGITAPTGWMVCDGNSIGNASSSATGRANADTFNLFALLWNNWADAQATVSGGRGVSASADFAANKRINLPDLRGRVSVCRDDETFLVIGGENGEETHILSEAELPASITTHSHNYNDISGTQAGVMSGGDFNTVVHPTLTTNTTSASSGIPGSSSTAHNNLQPSLTVLKIIKL